MTDVKTKNGSEEPTSFKMNQSKTEVLVVDDVKANLVITAKMLEILGYSAYIADSGSEAVKFCQSKKYDLIFMDCEMPEMDGFEASNLIRNQVGQNNDTPIVALTGNVLGAAEIENSSLDDAMTKPLSMESLKEKIVQHTDYVSKDLQRQKHDVWRTEKAS
ncbi:response regulator [Oligoflexaceae bacterium]|nr:response regulator [Oligoflexaceae bacterium]